MSDNQSNPKHECKCDGGKETKAIKKQVAELLEKIENLEKQIATLRKAIKK
jgi:archaellum component FlaC